MLTTDAIAVASICAAISVPLTVLAVRSVLALVLNTLNEREREIWHTKFNAIVDSCGVCREQIKEDIREVRGMLEKLHDQKGNIIK